MEGAVLKRILESDGRRLVNGRTASRRSPDISGSDVRLNVEIKRGHLLCNLVLASSLILFGALQQADL